MLDAEIPEFPVRGETGIDLFQRLEDPSQRRARFRCVATVQGDTVIDHQPEARRPAERLRALAGTLPVALPALSLADSRDWAGLAQATPDPLALFLYLEFLRAWQVVEFAARRFDRQLDQAPGTLPDAPGALAGAVAPLFDMNRTGRGMALARRLVPLLRQAVATPGYRDDRAGGTGYALRMLGDLSLRGGDPQLALACFETAVDAGDNPFRRRKAIEAARIAGDDAAEDRHRTAYAARWRLPPDLAGRMTHEGTPQ